MESESERVADEEEISEVKEMNVIPLRLISVEYSKNDVLSDNIDENQSTSKSKYYQQTYRPAWEQLSDFKGWLTGVRGQPRRAFCTYCQKTLHAHRLSLLKHTCTLKHQRAAQAHSSRKNKQNKPLSQLVRTVFVSDGDELLQETVDDQEAQIVEYSDSDFPNLEESLMEENEDENQEVSEPDYEEEENEKYEESDRDNACEMINVNNIKKYVNTSAKKQSPSFDPSISSGPISTVVTDATRGAPATGLAVSLYRLIDGRWTYINEGLTNVSGRFGSFVDRNSFVMGRYKLHYDVDRYFESRGIESVFPFVEVVFNTSTVSENYHFPLLLSPNSYTSFRG